jgi:hypothetical protein
MMRHLLPIALVFLVSCAHLGTGRSAERMRLDLWDQAHIALAAEDFETAEQIFERLAAEHPATSEGRESHFYLGTIRMDPRNPSFDPQLAEVRLGGYLERDTLPDGPVHRRPEAQTLLTFAMQLTLPWDKRIPGLQPPTQPTDTLFVVQDRRVVSYEEMRALQAELDRLQREVGLRDEQIRTQREELERIRRTLAPRRQ